MSTLSVVALLLAAGLNPVAAPRDELLRLVPEDTAICLVVQGLRDRSKVVAGSPLAAWVSEKYGPAVGAAPEIDKLKSVEALFANFLGVSLADLRDDVFGDVIVLTYQPGPAGRPEAEQGSVMLKARDPDKLAKLIKKLNALQQGNGELTGLVNKPYRGQAYTHRAKAEGKGEFYWLKDDLFVYAAQEASIQAVIDQSLLARPTPSPVARSIQQLGVQNAFLLCWLNPRKLDAEVKANAAAAVSAADKASRQQFARVWSALDAVVVHLDADRDLELGVSAAYRADALPDELKGVFAAGPKSSALWQVIPDDAILALAGRAKASLVTDLLLAWTPADEREAARQKIDNVVGAYAGRDKAADLLAGVGPDWGVWVTRPKKPSWFPEVTAAVRVDDKKELQEDVVQTVTHYLQNLRVGYNAQNAAQIDTKTDRRGTPSEVTTFTNAKLFPPGFRPAYGLNNGYLVFASSPELVQRFRRPDEAKADDTALVVRLSGASLQAYLRDHGPAVAGWLAEQQKRTAGEVKKELDTLAEFLSVLDRAELTVRGDGRTIRGTARLKFVQPLAK